MTTLALSGTVSAADAHIVFIRPLAKGGLELLGAHKLKQPQAVLDALAAVGAKGAVGEVTTVPAGKASPVPAVVAVGLGTSTDADDLRAATGNAVRGLTGRKKALLSVPDREEETLRALVEGALAHPLRH